MKPSPRPTGEAFPGPNCQVSPPRRSWRTDRRVFSTTRSRRFPSASRSSLWRCRRNFRGDGRSAAICSDTGWLILRLVQDLPNPPARSRTFRVGLIQTGAETGEGLQLLELGVGNPEIGCDGPGRLAVGPCRPRGRRIFPHPQREECPSGKAAGEIELPVRDGDQIGRDIARDILGLCLHDGQGRQGPAAVFLPEMG